MIVLHVLLWTLCGCAGAALVGVLVWAGIGVAELVDWIGRRLRRRTRLDYERYKAEQEIRTIRHQAIQDMLATSSRSHAYDDPDIIEGTAVEVTRQ